MVYVSWVIKELSQGLIPLPLWIPQLGMAIGTTVLTVAMLDRLVAVVAAKWQPEERLEASMDR